jgi:hypothetical protein
MKSMRKTAALAAALLFGALSASAIDCDCDPARPDTMKLRQCSLCNEAEKQPGDVEIFYLKDNNPRKPNRWLALPRVHGTGAHHMHDLSPKQRAQVWEAAIRKARELWGDEWGLAYNGEKVRTQCHTHVHIGKLLKGVERDNFVVVKRPSEIPVAPGEGVWVHPVGKKYHVHIGEQICETVLLR